MDFAREQVAHFMQSERGVVGDDRLRGVIATAAPQRRADEVIVIAKGDGRQSVKPMADALKVADLEVVGDMALAIPGIGRLLAGEIASLPSGGTVEGAKGGLGVSVGHA